MCKVHQASFQEQIENRQEIKSRDWRNIWIGWTGPKSRAKRRLSKWQGNIESNSSNIRAAIHKNMLIWEDSKKEIVGQ